MSLICYIVLIKKELKQKRHINNNSLLFQDFPTYLSEFLSWGSRNRDKNPHVSTVLGLMEETDMVQQV